MVNEPQEESLLGDVPAVSDAQWDSMLVDVQRASGLR